MEYLTPSPSSTQSLDTRSEPGFSDFASTPVAAESPAPPPVSPTFRMAQREAPPKPGYPPVPEPSLRHACPVNDRNYHMNSVHRTHVSDSVVVYDCQYDNCRDNGKIYHSLDVFRIHLQKRHVPTEAIGGEMEDMLKRCVFFFFFCFSLEKFTTLFVLVFIFFLYSWVLPPPSVR